MARSVRISDQARPSTTGSSRLEASRPGIRWAGVVLLSVCLLPLGRVSARAATIDISTALGNGADAFVVSNAAGSNFGSSSTVTLKRNDASSPTAGPTRKGYLRFDISSITDSIESIRLDLTISGVFPPTSAPAPAFTVYGLNDGHAGEAWAESGITWNNAPGNDTASTNGVGAGTTLLGTFGTVGLGGATAGDLVSFSSLALLNFALSDTNNLLTLIIVREDVDSSNENFASNNQGLLAAPTLEIQTVPEPGTWLMLTTGGLALAGRAWRRRRAASPDPAR